MAVRDDGMFVCADFVKDDSLIAEFVATTQYHAICPDDDGVDHSLLHAQAARIIGDERGFDPVFFQFDSSDAGTLIEWSRFVRDYVNIFSLIVSSVYHTECRSPVHGRQSASITMGHDRIAIFEEGGTILAELFISIDIGFGYLLGNGYCASTRLRN